MAEIAKIDASSYVDAIRTKIKNALVDLIPDEQWNAMLKQQIDAFLLEHKERDWHGNIQTKPSDLARIVLDLLNEEIRAQVKTTLASPEWKGHWVAIRLQVGTEIARVARENGASIINAWLAQAVQNFVNNLTPR